MTERMSTEEVAKSFERLVETHQDMGHLSSQLREYDTNETRPGPTQNFPNLDAFLEFHDQQAGYETVREELATNLRAAQEEHKRVSQRLGQIMPTGSTLSYVYEGERPDLQGWRFGIVSQGGRVVVRGTTDPETARQL